MLVQIPSTRELEALAAKAESLGPADLQALYGGLVSVARDRSATDGLFWLRFVVTRDEADPEHSVKPFPLYRPYIEPLWGELTTKSLVVVAKSRQMLVSWIVAAYCVWVARSKSHQAVYWQAQKAEDANAMVSLPKGGVKGRCQFIEEHLPPWLKQPVEAQSGRLVYPNGSFIEALAGGANQVRGKVYSVYVGDEFAHQEDQRGVYTSVAPLIQKGSRAILVSTPNGSDNLFATLFHGRQVSQESQAL